LISPDCDWWAEKIREDLGGEAVPVSVRECQFTVPRNADGPTLTRKAIRNEIPPIEPP
jgi:hypothetical protein